MIVTTSLKTMGISIMIYGTPCVACFCLTKSTLLLHDYACIDDERNAVADFG